MAFIDKQLTVKEPLVVAGRHVKRYEVVTPGLVITDDIRAAAYEFLPKLYPDFEDPTPPATVSVLHRSTAGMYLLAYNWAWDNVLHCRTAVSGDQPFLGSTDPDLTHFTVLSKDLIGCVWELPPLTHERSAWVRHMLEPDEADFEAYLADTMAEGPVGR
jgi:hypothetical protein